MKTNLYNIQQEHFLLIQEIIEGGGEITPEMENALQINREQLESKGLSYAKGIQYLNSEIDIIDSEIKRLEALKRIRKNTIARMEGTLENAMKQFELEEIVTPTLKINFRKSETVEIIDSSKVPNEYKTIETTTKIDKISLKRDIKAGTEIPGAKLNQNKNLQIK